MIAHSAFSSKDNKRVLIRSVAGIEMEISCSYEQYLDGLKAYKAGALMQHAFPMLNDDEREFLISGITPEVWNKLFGKGN